MSGVGAPAFGPPRSAYVHVPFCRAKCGYCDFNSYAGLLHLAPRYADAICRQISATTPGGHPLDTVYFGGGTPTTLPAASLARMLGALREFAGLAAGAETTLEANPESVSPELLAEARCAGFNRISIGCQSFDDAELRSLGRPHTAAQAVGSFQSARRAGFGNISMDLMFGLPGQTLAGFSCILEQAIALRPEHLSVYCLTIEEGTPFHEQARNGGLDVPNDDRLADMYLAAQQALDAAGYEHYEISNYALPGRRCRHNEGYWRNEPYFGFGPGAVQYVAGERVRWEPDPLAFVAQVEEYGRPRAESSERLESRALIGETAMLALRTADGLDLCGISRRFGQDAGALFSSQVRRFASAGLVRLSGSNVSLTSAGQLVANEVLAEFLQ